MQQMKIGTSMNETERMIHGILLRSPFNGENDKCGLSGNRVALVFLCKGERNDNQINPGAVEASKRGNKGCGTFGNGLNDRNS